MPFNFNTLGRRTAARLAPQSGQTTLTRPGATGGMTANVLTQLVNADRANRGNQLGAAVGRPAAGVRSGQATMDALVGMRAGQMGAASSQRIAELERLRRQQQQAMAAGSVLGGAVR